MRRHERRVGLIVTLVAAFALVAQPLFSIDVEKVFAATREDIFTVANVEINKNGSYSTGAIDVSGYENLEFAFDYNYKELDNGESFTYSLKVDGVEVAGDTISGANADDPEDVSISEGLVNGNEVRLDASVNAGSDGDIVRVKNIVLKGEVVSEPEITYLVAGKSDSAKYKGVSVNFGTSGISDAKSVAVTVTRADDSKVVKNSKPAPSGSVSGVNAGEVTTPFIIQHGTYNEAGSGSWFPAPAIWTSATRPVSVTVLITLGDDTTLEKSAPITISQSDYVAMLITPSTNEINKAKNWPHVEVTSKTSSSITFDFVAERNNAKNCFEYRTDGDINQKISETNNNSQITDGKYPHFCLYGETQRHTIGADDFVEIRLAWNAEKDERFDWTRFDVLEGDTNPPVVSFVNPKPYYNPTTDNGKFSMTATDDEGVVNWGLKFLDKNDKDLRIGSVPCIPQVTGKNASATCYASIDFGKFVHGETYTALATAKDAAGNVGTATHDFIADMEAPNFVSFQYKKDTSAYKDLAIDVFNPSWMSANFRDATSFTNDVYIKVYRQKADGSWQLLNANPYHQSGNGSERNYAEMRNSLFTTDGTYKLEAYARDIVGNTSNPRTSNPFFVDNTAPSAPTSLTWKTSNGATIGNDGYTNIYSGVASWQDSSDDDVRYLYSYWNDIAGNRWKEDNRYKPSAISGMSMAGAFTEGQGTHYIQVFAIDRAGNVSEGSDTLTINYDKTPPILVTFNTPHTDIDIANQFTISGTYSDDFSGIGRLHLYVSANGHQLVNPFIVKPSQLNKTNGAWTYTLSLADLAKLKASPLNLKGGDNFTVKAWAYDRANNWSNFVQDFTVAEPTLTGDYFVPHADHLGVGFSVDRFDDATKIEVELFDADNNSITKNVGESTDMVNLLNSHTGQISSPFYIPGQPDDDYWTFGEADWADVTPAYAVVTVFYGGGEKHTDKIYLGASELGYTYESLIDSLPRTAGVSDKKTETNPNKNKKKSKSKTRQPSITRPAGSTIAQTVIQSAITPFWTASGSAASNAAIAQRDGTARTLAATDEQEIDTTSAAEATDNELVDENEEAGLVLGLTWYWWPVIAVAVAGLLWWLVAALRKKQPQE